MIKDRHVLNISETRIAYTLFRSEVSSHKKFPRRILLLHGAGVAGELTWTFIVNYLKHWDEVLVPDLLGMGESFFEDSDQLDFTIEDICHSLLGLLNHHQWYSFDLVGYSLGGLVALELNALAGSEVNSLSGVRMHVDSLCLIEPALLSDESLQSSLVFRQAFLPLAENIKSEPDNDQYFLDFLNLVSPNRKRSVQMDKLAIKRLQLRPLGFAHALSAVSEYADYLDEYKLQQLLASIPRGLGIVGGLSNPGLMLAQKKIQCLFEERQQENNQKKHWHIKSVANADHSLVYVRPKVIAGLINDYLGNLVNV